MANPPYAIPVDAFVSVGVVVPELDHMPLSRLPFVLFLSVKVMGVVPAVTVPEAVHVVHKIMSLDVVVVSEPQFMLLEPVPEVCPVDVCENPSMLCAPANSMNTPPTNVQPLAQSVAVGCPVTIPPTLMLSE